MRFTPFSLVLTALLALSISSCSNDSAPGEKKDSMVEKTILLPMQGEREPGFDSANADVFRKILYKEYAMLGVQLPKGVADSILKDAMQRKLAPDQMNELLDRRMKGQDSIARQTLARKYDISLDSVAAILEMGRERKW